MKEAPTTSLNSGGKNRKSPLLHALDRFHFCPLDSECRKFAAPWRLHFRGKRYFWILALRPQDRCFSPRRNKWVFLSRDPLTKSVEADFLSEEYHL